MRYPTAGILGITLIATILGGCADRGGYGSPAPGLRLTSAAPTHVATPPSPTDAWSAVAPSAAVTPSADPAAYELPTRIVLVRLGIDLPIVSGDLSIAGNPPDYPLCDVAQYLTTYRYPGRPGTTTWIYGHARPGMFLPLLEASMVADGNAIIGLPVDLYSDGVRRYRYRITGVMRHATDRSSAGGVPANGRRLVLQTSEGPRGTVPKLQVIAEFMSVAAVDPIQAMPVPSPRACFRP